MILENIQDLILISKVVNNNIIYDTSKRIMDWIGSGESPDDKYVKDQLAYVSNVINSCTSSIDIKKLSDISKQAKEKSMYKYY